MVLRTTVARVSLGIVRSIVVRATVVRAAVVRPAAVRPRRQARQPVRPVRSGSARAVVVGSVGVQKFVGEGGDDGGVVGADQVRAQQREVDVGLGEALPDVAAAGPHRGADRVGERDHVAVGLQGEILGQIQPRELRRPGGSTARDDPRPGHRGRAAGLVPARVDGRGFLLGGPSSSGWVSVAAT